MHPAQTSAFLIVSLQNESPYHARGYVIPIAIGTGGAFEDCDFFGAFYAKFIETLRVKKSNKENKIPFTSFWKKLSNKHPPTEERCLLYDKAENTSPNPKKPLWLLKKHSAYWGATC